LAAPPGTTKHKPNNEQSYLAIVGPPTQGVAGIGPSGLPGFGLISVVVALERVPVDVCLENAMFEAV
jgi:hypothetical protein